MAEAIGVPRALTTAIAACVAATNAAELACRLP